MLVLTRAKNEQILIGPNIVLTVLSVHGNRVRLGVEADRDVPVVRGELKDGEREVEEIKS